MSDSSDYDSDSALECPNSTISEEEIEKLIHLFKKDVHRNYGLFVSLSNVKKQRNKGQNISNKYCTIENQNNTNTNIQINNYEHNQITVLPKYANEFFGRQNELTQLQNLLEHDKLCYIVAENGTGKTEFVKFYIENYHFKYSSIEFINAKNLSKFDDSISYICSKYNIQNISNFFKDKSSLIIIDNYDRYINFREYFPRSSKSTILILSSTTSNDNHYNLPNLSTNESLDILQSILQENFNKATEKNWKELCEYFENIPLALQIIGGCINEQMSQEKHLTVETCLRMYKQVNNRNKNHVALLPTLQTLCEDVLNVLNTCVYLDDEFISAQVLFVHESINYSKDKLDFVIDNLRKYRLIYVDMKDNMKFIHIHEEIRNSLILFQKTNNSQRKYFIVALGILVHITILNMQHILHILQYVKTFIQEFTGFILSNNRKAVFEVIIQYNYHDILDNILTIIPNKQLIIKQDNLMFIASYYEQLDIIRVLINHAADINAIYNNETVLHNSSKKLLVSFVEVLLLNGANPNIENDKGNNCLHLAVINSKIDEDRSVEITKMFIETGVDASAKNLKGYNALYYALKNKSFKLALLLLNLCTITITSIVVIFEWNADQENEVKMLKIIKKLSKNVNLIDKDKNGQNILMWAVKNRYVDIVRFVLTDSKIDVNDRDKSGQTALHKILDQSIYNKKQAKLSVEIIKLLLDNFAETDIKDNEGYTAYDYGQLRGNIKLCLYIQFISFELPKDKKDIFYYTQRYIEPPNRKPPPKPYFWETKSFSETLTSVGNVAKDAMYQAIMHQPQSSFYSQIAGPSYLQISGPP